MLDVERVRAQFPALALTLDDGRPCLFLDNPAGTQVPRRVVDANMTTLTFAIARAIGRDLAPGDEVLCTVLDHDANIAPWLALEEERGVRVRLADMHPDDGTLDLADLERKLSSQTRLVAVTYASNALGTINDVARITALAHHAGALVWIDAVHYAPHGLIDVAALDCDFLACSAYKFFGPHVGILYGKREHLERLRPYKVRPADDVTPSRWETGTLNHEGLAGVMNAVDYIASLGAGPEVSRRSWIERALGEIRAYERTLAERLIAGLRSIAGCAIYGITDPARFAWRVPTVACRLEGFTPRQVAERLADEGIFVWDGNYYALAVMQRLGLEDSGGAVRIGPVHYNTAAEIDRTLDVLRTMARG